MALTFPGNCITSSERTEYCYRAQELLRKLHNIFGKWFKEGITQTYDEGRFKEIYNRYPEKIEKSNMYESIAQFYFLQREGNEIMRYPLDFVKDANGDWKLDSL